MLGLLLVISSSSGCLEVPIESCEDTDCFPFNNDLLNELLSNPNSLDVLLLASENSKLRVKSSTTYQTETQQGEIRWNIAKNDEQNLRSIAMRFSLGTTSIDTEAVSYTHLTLPTTPYV